MVDCNRAVTLDPKDANALNARAWVYHLAHRDAEGLADAEKAVALAPKDGNDLETRAEIYERIGRRASAIVDYRRSLKLDPTQDGAKAGLKRLGAAT